MGDGHLLAIDKWLPVLQKKWLGNAGLVFDCDNSEKLGKMGDGQLLAIDK